MPAPVPRALIRVLGGREVRVVQASLQFHAPKQGKFQPPAYRIDIDTTATPWLTCRHYNAAPRALEVKDVRVPTEMTRFTLTVKTGPKRALSQWAKKLLSHE
jgi:hypothetical protein